MSEYRFQDFPKSRLATIDICETGRKKHHVSGFIELDITESRKKIRAYNRERGEKISFLGWFIKIICETIKKYDTTASYLKGRNSVMIFEDTNVSLLVEKELNGQKVPIPLLIEKADKISAEEITKKINDAKSRKISERDIVLQKKADRLENLYYHLPGFLRRYFWKYLLKHPKLAFVKMGNVAITSIGMAGRIKGWFVPISVHPICFGLSSVLRKPVAIEDKIEIREVLNLTILLDHDVLDGAQMARFISELTENIESGMGTDCDDKLVFENEMITES